MQSCQPWKLSWCIIRYINLEEALRSLLGARKTATKKLEWTITRTRSKKQNFVNNWLWIYKNLNEHKIYLKLVLETSETKKQHILLEFKLTAHNLQVASQLTKIWESMILNILRIPNGKNIILSNSELHSVFFLTRSLRQVANSI